MISNFTQNDLIQFIYGEADKNLEDEIKSALKSDVMLFETYCQILDTVNSLENFKLNPDNTSLRIIMEESTIIQGESLVN